MGKDGISELRILEGVAKKPVQKLSHQGMTVAGAKWIGLWLGKIIPEHWLVQISISENAAVLSIYRRARKIQIYHTDVLAG